MRINGETYTIVGVMPATVSFPARAELWLPSVYDLPPGGGPDPRQNRGGHYLRGIARLKAGVSLASANAELETIGQQLARAYPDTNSNFTPLARPLQDVLVRSARTPLMVLLGAVLCVLLIVVANVANLLMARATVRARELAIRAALGAGRGVLVRQLLTESVLLAVIGGGLGVLLAFWGVDLILALEPGDIPRVAPIVVNGQALTFAVVLSIVTGLLFGVVPAWQASRPELQNTLKDATRGTTGDGHRHLARMGLVLAEVSLSLMLLVGAGLLFRSLMNLLDVPLGFSSARITTTQVAPTGEGYRAPGQTIALLEPGAGSAAGHPRRGEGGAHQRRADGRLDQHPQLQRRPASPSCRRTSRRCRTSPACRRASSRRWAFRSCAGASSSAATRWRTRAWSSSTRRWPVASSTDRTPSVSASRSGPVPTISRSGWKWWAWSATSGSTASSRSRCRPPTSCTRALPRSR